MKWTTLQLRRKYRQHTTVKKDHATWTETYTAFDIDDLIDKSDGKLYRQATQPATLRTIFSLLKPSPTVLISFVRGNIHTCFPLFNIRNSKTLILIIVYLNMYNPLIVVLCVFSFFNSSYCTFYALCFIFCVFCVFHWYSLCNSVRLSYWIKGYLLTYLVRAHLSLHVRLLSEVLRKHSICSLHNAWPWGHRCLASSLQQEEKRFTWLHKWITK